MIPTKTLQKGKPFWKRVIQSDVPLQLWGGADSIETGADGLPEVVDYKYFSDQEHGQNFLDMDLMPKIYILLCAQELLDLGFKKSRFLVRLWNDPLNEDFYEEFDLDKTSNLEDFFKDKIERILRTSDLTFCDKDYCKVCKSPQREEWIAELLVKGYIGKTPEVIAAEASDLPF